MEIIVGKQGNQKLRITEPTVSRRHCKVTSNADGTYTIENLSNTTYTKVDGIEIIRTTAGPNSELQLGPNFKMKLKDLIPVPQASYKPSTRQTPPPPPVKTFNISHLRYIWEEYNNKNHELQEKQRKVTLIRSGSMIFSMGGGLIAALSSVPVIGWAFTGIGLIALGYSFIGMKNSESSLERQQRQAEFDDKWVCPNPECGRNLIAKDFRYLVRNYPSCPHCKCKYVIK